MLEELLVDNLGIIGLAHVEPGPGLVVVTGETGAGKTLLLGALELLAGGTGRSDRVGPGSAVARVEGRFRLSDGSERVATRRILREGRSRAYLDGSMAPVARLQQEIAPLVEMVAQHDQPAVTRPGEVRRMLDGALDEPGRTALDEYRMAWQRLRELETARRRLGGDRHSLERELDLVTHQAAEIAAAGFSKGDDETLKNRATRLRHAASLAESLGAVQGGLESARGLDEAVAELRRASRLDPTIGPLAEQAGLLTSGVAELAAGVREAWESLDHDPGELDDLENRLSLLASLQRKYGDGLDDVLAFGERAAARRSDIMELLGSAGRIDEEAAGAHRRLVEAGERLGESRRATAARLTGAALGHLKELGFTDPVLEIRVTPAAPAAHGADDVSVVFASTASLPPGPVARVASGGELSRLVLALRLAGGAGEAPIVAFDEVDAGVGGATALALGAKLAGLAVDRQVLCVTHLPQIAAYADTHLVVERIGGSATVREVDGDSRLEELSRMLSGLPDSEQGRMHAAELREVAQAARRT